MAKVTVTEPRPSKGGDPVSRQEAPPEEPQAVIREDAPAPVWVAARLIERSGEVALVEWDEGDDWRRAYVPATELTPRGVTASVLAAGVPYGVRWESVIGLPTPQQLGRALRQQGIWTADDLARRMTDANQALLRVSLDSLRRAVRAAKE